MIRPTMFLIAGPNGAGKSTLYETRIAPFTDAPFINADNIQRFELKTADVSAAYEAARMADQRRTEFMEARYNLSLIHIPSPRD